MTDTHETIADVVAWLRRPREGENAYLTLWRDEIADRIEAAYKREVQNALDAGGFVEASRKNKQVGDAAKLREALKATLGLFFDIHNANRSPQSNQAYAVIRKIKAALAAPPRNCDRFADELDAQLAFLNEVWLISIDRETMTEQDTYEKWTDEMRTRYGRWLLAPATEKEGGAK